MAYLFRGYWDHAPPAPQKDNVFFNKGTNKLYRYDGDKWIEFDPSIRILTTEIKPEDPYKAYERAMGVI